MTELSEHWSSAKTQLKLVIKKANGLCIWGADVYLVVRYHGRYHEYSSLNDPAWPPNRDQVVSLL